ncbi:hypothetical protein D3C85_1149930 [compost metagenome]
MRGEAVELTLGNGLAADQLRPAVVIDLGQAQVGQGGAEQGSFHIAVELQQRLADLDLLPGLELHDLDGARHFQAQVDPLQGREAAHRRQTPLPHAFAGLGSRHVDRRLGRGKLLDLLVNGKGLVAPQYQHDQQNDT